MSKSKRPLTRSSIFLILLASLFFTACAGQTDNQNWPGLSSDGEVVYMAYGPGVAAYDAVEQEELWNNKTDNNTLVIYAPPSVVDGRVVIGDYGASGGMFSPGIIVSIYGQEINEGASLLTNWTNSELASDKIVASTLQVGDVAYVGSADFNMYALDANTGDLIWQFTTNGAIWGQPTFHEGTLFVTSLDKNVYALDAETGDEIWRTELGGAISAKPLLNVDANLLYVGAYDNAMHALDPDTGEEQWQAESSNWIWNAPALADDVLYFADSGSQVFAVDALTGEEIWTSSINEMREVDGVLLQTPERIEGAIQASPVIHEDVLYIASEGNRASKEGLLVALNAETGEEIWQTTTNEPLYSTPVVANGSIVVAMNRDVITLIGFDLETGNRKWSYLPNAEE